MNLLRTDMERKIEEIIELLKSFDFVHSIMLFGSISREKSGRDIDICIIPSRNLSFKERLAVEAATPPDFDISIYSELPIHIRKRISEEGTLLYTEDIYHLLTIFKETDLEYRGYRRYREYYIKAARERIRMRFGKKVG